MKPYYEYQHIVSFAETNLVGNVYYTNHLSWQGRCREMFLHDRAPDVLADLQHNLALVTVRVSCDYLSELVAFDRLAIRMRLASRTQNRATMSFEYWRQYDDDVGTAQEELIAHGEQQVACMRRNGDHLTPTPFPKTLQDALDEMAKG